MNTNLFRWSLALLQAEFSAFLRLPSLVDQAYVARGGTQDISSADRGHSKISSLPPSTALE